MELKTMKVGSREYPVLGYIKTKQAGVVPLVDIPMMSDYEWQEKALLSRLENPEFYRKALGEDVETTIAKIRKWLSQAQRSPVPDEVTV